MAITWGRWRRTDNGEPVTHITVTHSCTRAELADLLIAGSLGHLDPETEPPPELTKAETERRIRGQLVFNREAGDWWSERIHEDHHVTVMEWADRQVGKLNPPAGAKPLLPEAPGA